MDKANNQYAGSNALPALGISKTQSSRWQQAASVPEEQFLGNNRDRLVPYCGLRYRDSEAIMISLSSDFDFPEGESSSPEDIVHGCDDPNDFSLWQPAFAVLAPPSEKAAS